jgi:hypothetical protein
MFKKRIKMVMTVTRVWTDTASPVGVKCDMTAVSAFCSPDGHKRLEGEKSDFLEASAMFGRGEIAHKYDPMAKRQYTRY